MMSTRPPTNLTSLASSGSRDPSTTQGPARAAAHPNARLLLRIDGGFEAVLGVLLVSSPVTGFYKVIDLPGPASKPVVIVVGLLLFSLFPILWLVSRAPGRRLVLELAIANGVGALVFILWVLVWNRSFQPIGAIFVLVVAGILAILSALQVRVALVAD